MEEVKEEKLDEVVVMMTSLEKRNRLGETSSSGSSHGDVITKDTHI